jgi:hypothetical protein
VIRRWSRHSRRSVAMNRWATADQEVEPVGAVAQVHEQVAGLLGDPGPSGVRGDPGNVHATTLVLDHDQDVETTQEQGIDVGEVDREDRVGLRGEELSPGRPRPSPCGSRPSALRIAHTVDAAIRWPSPTSSP